MRAQLTSNAQVVRRAKLHGRDHLVAPTVLIVPGVLNGSQGAILYPAKDVAESLDAWNGMPVVVYHPHTRGSARSPETVDSQKIGEVYNARIRDGKLMADVWIDVARAQQIDPRVLNALESGRSMEVSTGLVLDASVAPNGASWNGRSYALIASNLRPDHLAVLPDQTGACSIKDGCGLLVGNRVRPKVTVENCDGDKTCGPCAEKRKKGWKPIEDMGGKVHNVRDPKVGKCVDDVVATGKDKVTAIKICQASIGRAYHPAK